ncbi:hypothetical protein IKF63_01420 [Candidatus Saccharibacteria bacterium]|nr:hypothetical protein [Candidatus Saccharibacteria bacterium]
MDGSSGYGDVYSQNEEKSKIWLFVVAGVMVLAIVLAVLGFVFGWFGKSSKISSGVMSEKSLEKYCEKQGLRFENRTEEMAWSTEDGAVAEYYCGAPEMAASEEASPSNSLLISLTEFSKSFREVPGLKADLEAAQKSIKPGESGWAVMSSSDDLVKLVMVQPYGDMYTFHVFYGKSFISITSSSLEEGEKVMNDLGVPDRGNKMEETKVESEKTDEEMTEILGFVRAAVRRYVEENGRLVPTDESPQVVNGDGETELDSFYNNYLKSEEFEELGGNEFELRVYSEQVPNRKVDSEKKISVFYGSSCDKNGRVEIASDGLEAAITFPKADGKNYICVTAE